jgi:hypothetical protein
MSKPLKIIGLGCAAIVGVIVIALFVVGSIGPDTSVYPGRQIPKRFLTTIRSLNLLKDDEQIRYFYSDAMLDIKAGLYFVTDKNLVLYSSSWDEPKTIIPFDQIESLDVQYDDSFLEDTYVFVTTSSGMEVSFPLSSERGLDKKFVKAIQEKLNVEPGGAANESQPIRSEQIKRHRRLAPVADLCVRCRTSDIHLRDASRCHCFSLLHDSHGWNRFLVSMVRA